jgi:ABC-type glycerol-3-phosphate transport system substrate-binding protein
MKLRPFELFLVAVFGVLGLVALALLATYKPPTDKVQITLGNSVVIWGTVDQEAFAQVLQPLIAAKPAFKVVTYVKKNLATFDDELLNALADGVGPDILFLPSDKLVQYRTKIQPLSYQSFPLPDFQSRYIDGAEIFALSDGVYAFPVAVDPLVMYWNRDILGTYNFVNPPTTWEAVVNQIVPTIVVRDFKYNITRSPLAFGEYRNVTNAFDVLSMLLLQGGSSMVSELDGTYKLFLNQNSARNSQPFESAVTFYTSFSNPTNPLYSWNRSLPNDRAQFISEDLALYFGRGSEARGISAQNPNLNFAVAEVPQGASATVRRTYGTFYGYAILKSSRNQSGSYTAIQELANTTQVQVLATSLGMAPVYRQLLSVGSNDQYGRVIYNTAVVARGWLSPKPAITNEVFLQMIEDVLANRRRPGESANDAVNKLRSAY